MMPIIDNTGGQTNEEKLGRQRTQTQAPGEQEVAQADESRQREQQAQDNPASEPTSPEA
jgi:hypothetical protein